MGDERERMQLDIESYRREQKKLLAEIERMRAAAAAAAMNENYTLEGQRVLQEMAAENARLRALLAEHVSAWCARRHTFDDPPCGDCLPCRTREAIDG